MSSEIRVNKINNRAGLGTVTYTDTGIIVSGVSTASNFKTGTSDLHSAGLNVAYADVDDFVDVGNIIKLGNAGVVTATTFSTSNVDVTTDKIVVGTGVTIEANQVATGQATFTGIVTASAFKLSDGSNVGGIESDSMLNTVGGTLSGPNIVIGGNSSSSGTSNTLYGYQSGRFIAQGDGNTILGSSAGRNVDNDNYNTLIGGQAGRNMSSSNNTCVGYQASYMNNAQGNTVAFGYEAAKNATNAGRFTAMGYQAGKAHTGGNGNTYVGYQAGYLNGSGDMNCVMGDQTVRNSSDFNRATVFGAYAAGGFGSNANDNTVIGYNAGSSTLTGTNNIIMGSGANLSGNVSNEITLGNSNISLFRVPGINLTIGNNGANFAGVVTATSFSGDGSSLSNLPASAPVGGASTNTVFFENDVAVAVNYQITTNKNAMSAGPIAINAGIAVTVPSGSSWTIV